MDARVRRAPPVPHRRLVLLLLAEGELVTGWRSSILGADLYQLLAATRTCSLILLFWACRSRTSCLGFRGPFGPFFSLAPVLGIAMMDGEDDLPLTEVFFCGGPQASGHICYFWNCQCFLFFLRRAPRAPRVLRTVTLTLPDLLTDTMEARLSSPCWPWGPRLLSAPACACSAVPGLYSGRPLPPSGAPAWSSGRCRRPRALSRSKDTYC